MPDDHEAHDYAERIRERLPRRLQELRERAGITKYALGQVCGVSREMLAKIERKDANPTLCLVAQVSHGLGLTLSEFVGDMEDAPAKEGE